jgi:putative RecB family exonuclease
LSASSINDYIECGLLYKLGRIDRLPLEFGSAIHLTLGDFYQYRMSGDALPLKKVQSCFETHWRLLAEGRDNIKYAEGKDFETYLREEKELLAVWHSKLPEDDFKVLSIEEAFRLRIPEVQVPLIGATDLVEEDNAGTIIITN